MKNKTRILSALLLSGALFAGRAGAAVVSFTDPAAYQAASTGNTSYTFTGQAAGVNPTDEGQSFANGPITFTTTNGDIDLYNDSNFGTGVQYIAAFSGGLNLTLASTATAVSFDLGTYVGADTIDITINGDPTLYSLTEAGGHPDTGFIGFTSTDPITTLTFTNVQGSELDTIDFSLGTNGAVPEPSTWAALLGGVFLLGAALKPRLSTGH